MLRLTRPFFIIITLIILFSSQSYAQKAPAFTLEGDKGKISLSNYKNQVVYIDFWASWCKPCRKSFTFMNEMQDRYGKKGFKIIAINLDNEREAANDFLKKHPAKFSIAYDKDGKTPGLYKLKVMPTSYLIDRRGNLLNIHKGFKENQTNELENLIIQALNKK
ncbi:MAG: TlpA family protein disulfide reductase [Gammaproteobacteria bacterium]|nr:TlpA family protein disulfide reductase [Gammaproteobacteria bacterium]